MKKIFRYIILACMFLMLVACGKKESEKAFDLKFKEFKEEITKNGNEGLESTKLLAKIFDKATYSAEPTEEELNKKAVEYLTELLKNEKDLEINESNIQIQMTKIDGKWEIENSGDFFIALYGGQGELNNLPAQN